MNLNHSPFSRRRPLSRLPRDIAALAVGIVEDTSAAVPLEAPADPEHVVGAFNGPMAAALTRWKDE